VSVGNRINLASSLMTELHEQGRPRPPRRGRRSRYIVGILEYERTTLAWKCSGLDTAGLKATLGPSSMTLGGMLKHLARVEDYWFSYALHARDTATPWNTVDWKANPDRDWESATEDSPEQLFAFWRDATDRSRDLVAEALTDGDLGQRARVPGTTASRRACVGSSSQ